MVSFPDSANESTPILTSSPPRAYTYEDVSDADSGREVEVWHPGKSTFSQTLLNTLGDLIGTGLLAVPIAIAHSGWVVGPLMLAVIAIVTLWTLKILLRIIERDRRLRNFTDVIAHALGPTGEKVVTVLFVVEVAAWIVTLVILFSDSLEAVWPIYTSNEWKLVGLVVIIPTTFLPLRYLSFSSAAGIFSTWALVGILIYSGIVTPHAPGSIRDPAPTDIWPSHGWIKLGTVFGLLISGPYELANTRFGGHTLVPNLIHDMKNPKQADRVCEVAYGIAMVVYIAVGGFGYLMYGSGVSDEVSRDLARTGPPVLAKIAVWMVALNPLTKIALGVRPLADLIFHHFDLHKTVLVPHGAPTPRYVTRPSSPTSSTASDRSVEYDYAPTFDPGASHFSVVAEARHTRRERVKDILRPVIRVALAVASVLAALVFPSFENLMSLLGAGLASITVIIIPVTARATIWGWTWVDIVVVGVAGVAGLFGTVATILN